jgi:tetratricopeptide (TPR) repeat protein
VRLFVGLCLSLAGAAQQAPAPSPTEVFAQANQAFDQKRYPEAIADYARLAQQGDPTGWIHYNLGNAYLRGGQLGKAVASYLRSEALLPRHRDLQHNLAYARQQTRDALGPIEPSPLNKILFFWHYLFSTDELLYMLAAVHGLFFLALGLWAYLPASGHRRAAASTLGLMWLGLGGSWLIHTTMPPRLMVVLADEVDVHSGTTDDSMVRFRLHEGTVGRLVDQDGSWLRIELADGKQGWLPLEEVEPVQL